jgi:hypothetical protein
MPFKVGTNTSVDLIVQGAGAAEEENRGTKEVSKSGGISGSGIETGARESSNDVRLRASKNAAIAGAAAPSAGFNSTPGTGSPAPELNARTTRGQPSRETRQRGIGPLDSSRSPSSTTLGSASGRLGSGGFAGSFTDLVNSGKGRLVPGLKSVPLTGGRLGGGGSSPDLENLRDIIEGEGYGTDYTSSGTDEASSGGTSSTDSTVESDTTVYEFDRSAYDSEISQIGVISAIPEVVCIVPLKNLYEKSGEVSNLGVLYDLQNSLRDSTITRAQEVVDQYYSENPDAQAQLGQIRDENTSKYTVLATSLPQIAGLKQAVISTTSITTPSQDVQQKVDSAVATTTSESNVSRGEIVLAATLPTAETTTSSTTNNRSVQYIDDDVTKYDSGKDIILSLSEKLLGDTGDTTVIPAQSKTARQYQLMKAVLAQILEGRLYTPDSLDQVIQSPYQDIEYAKVAPVTSLTADNIENCQGIEFAKVTLDLVGDAVSKNFQAIDFNTTAAAAVSRLSSNGVYYAGQLARFEGRMYGVQDSYVDAVAEYEVNTHLYSSDGKVSHLPIIGLDSEVDNYSFYKQVVPVLSALIAESEIGSLLNSGIPASISPGSAEIVSISNTSSDSIRYVAETSSGKKIFLFDETLQTSEIEQSDPVSSIVSLSIPELEALKTQIDQIISNLDGFVSDNKNFFTNQCAMTIFQTFFDHYISFFEESVLMSNEIDSLSTYETYSASRVALFSIATHSEFAAAKLYSIIHNEDAYPFSVRSGKSVFSPAYAEFKNMSDLGRYEFSTEGFHLEGISSKKKLEFVPTYSSFSDFFKNLCIEGSSFDTFRNITNELTANYTTISSNQKIVEQIRFASFIMFLRVLSKIKISGYFRVDYDCYVEWHQHDIALAIDCLKSIFTATSADEVSFSKFVEITGSEPTNEQRANIDSLLQELRKPVTGALQMYQDFRSLIAYQKTVLSAQSNYISSVISLHNKIKEIYGEEKTAQIVGRYLTLESAVEALYRTSRYLNFVPGTLISSIATRSRHYRSIVKAAFKDLILKKENLSICVIGLPYGHLELLRLAKEDISFYYNVRVFADPVDESENRIDYSGFGYISSSETNRPENAGPYSSKIPGVVDDYTLPNEVSSTSDDSISIYEISETGGSLNIISRNEATNYYGSIDFPAAVVQAALQAYVEDIYGLYPRYATTKSPLRSDPYPEESIADAALQSAGFTFDTTDNQLIYSRLRAMIMMHQDFMTTRMLEEMECSFVFDKLLYLVVDGDKYNDIVSQFYTKVEA